MAALQQAYTSDVGQVLATAQEAAAVAMSRIERNSAKGAHWQQLRSVLGLL